MSSFSVETKPERETASESDIWDDGRDYKELDDDEDEEVEGHWVRGRFFFFLHGILSNLNESKMNGRFSTKKKEWKTFFFFFYVYGTKKLFVCPFNMHLHLDAASKWFTFMTIRLYNQIVRLLC